MILNIKMEIFGWGELKELVTIKYTSPCNIRIYCRAGQVCKGEVLEWLRNI